MNRSRWVALTLLLLAGTWLAYEQPWQPRLLVHREAERPPGPSNVKDLDNFPDGLPICGLNESVAATAPLDPARDLVGKKVMFTGTLSLAKHRMCTLKGCLDSRCCNSCWIPWQIGGFGNSETTVTFKKTLELNECEPSPSVAMRVVATGVLLLGASTVGPEDKPGFRLEHANLCVVGPWR